ncbi:hypothetical protein TGARI_248190B, partial [Toxoplasma gondii ARI]
VRLLTKAPQKQATQRRFVLGLKAALVALSARKRVQREAAKSEKEETDVEKKERDSESREREEESEDEEENMEKKRTPKLIVLAANCEPTVSEGGLSDLIQRVLAAARAKGVPVVFCASRNRMK